MGGLSDLLTRMQHLSQTDPCSLFPSNFRAAPSIKAPSVKAVDAYGQLLVDIMNTRVENEQSEYFSAFFGVMHACCTSLLKANGTMSQCKKDSRVELLHQLGPHI